MTSKIAPLGGIYENMEYTRRPDGGADILIRQNWPDPEVRGKGVVTSKDGKVRKDGSNPK